MPGMVLSDLCFFFQAEDGIRDYKVTGVQTCALPISCHEDNREEAELEEVHDGRVEVGGGRERHERQAGEDAREEDRAERGLAAAERSEEHTSELQSPCNLVCRLLLEKKKTEGRIVVQAHLVREE